MCSSSPSSASPYSFARLIPKAGIVLVGRRAGRGRMSLLPPPPLSPLSPLLCLLSNRPRGFAPKLDSLGWSAHTLPMGAGGHRKDTVTTRDMRLLLAHLRRALGRRCCRHHLSGIGCTQARRIRCECVLSLHYLDATLRTPPTYTQRTPPCSAGYAWSSLLSSLLLSRLTPSSTLVLHPAHCTWSRAPLVRCRLAAAKVAPPPPAMPGTNTKTCSTPTCAIPCFRE